LQSLERRHALEVEELKSEVTSNKRKYEECLELLEATKRKAGLSKENGILEGRVELETAKASLRELETQLRVRESEFSKYRDDQGAMAGRLASALQTTQVSVAECEVAKAQAASAVSECQVSQGALLQATLRIQQLESECMQVKSELLLLRSQGEGQEGELRRLQNSVSAAEEKLTLTAADLKRLKATAQVLMKALASRLIG
jgi:chromosome segregation ATPase